MSAFEAKKQQKHHLLLDTVCLTSTRSRQKHFFTMFWGGFSASKLKPQLKMAVTRIKIASNKKSALLKQSIREVAILLQEDPPKEEKAKIRAEALIRDDNLIEAYEILELSCELLHERIKLIEHCKTCPPDMIGVVATLIWASHRVDIPELNMIRKQFSAKYGKKFMEEALENKGGILNERVVSKLSVEPPAAYLVQTYMERICEQHKIDWKPSFRLSAEQMIAPMAAPVGYSVPVAQGTGLGPVTAVYAETGDLDAHDDETKLPPPAPTQTIATASAYVPSSAPSGTEEPDIFVPAAPLNPPSESPAPSNEISTLGNESADGTETIDNGDDDEDNDNNNNNAPDASGHSSSYANLAARFESLQK